MAVKKAQRAARKGRAIQDKVRSKEPKNSGGSKARESKSAAQTAPRTQPAPPQPRQHQDKPGHESQLKPRPRYSAPAYRGSGKLEGKVAIITGGDSGIGRAVAVLFAREGADVAIVYLTEHGDAAETGAAIEHEGREALLIPGDVADPAFCRSAVAQTLDRFGQVNILVNNAAFQQHVTSFEDLTEEQWDHTFRTNIYGYFYMAKAAVPHLGDGGVIINTGSVTAFDGSPGLLDYSATKGAIHTFTRSLSEMLLKQGIRVNAVAPGPVWTPLNPSDAPAEKVAEFGKSVAMGRPAQPEELAPAYVFLAAPSCSSYITGEVIKVVGGYE
jgi:NAD(P)-dependent dehydrogenase (short-subunit alcohol dehydrogenase family)